MFVTEASALAFGGAFWAAPGSVPTPGTSRSL